MIKTKKDYWKLITDNLETLIPLIKKYHPYYKQHHKVEITAPHAEKMRQGVANQIIERTKKDPAILFLEYLINEDPGIAKIFNETWWGMPESNSVRQEPGFGILCDLCTETDVLNGDSG